MSLYRSLSASRTAWRAVFFSVVLGLVSVSGSFGASAGEPASPIVGRVDGDPIYREDLNDREIAEARQKLYDLESAELRRQSMTLLREKRPEEFPLPEVTVTDAEVKQLYDSAKLSRQGTLESLADRIRMYLESRKRAEVEELQYQMALSRGYIENNLRPPKVFLVSLRDVNRAASLGVKDAPIRIVEFSDFQCPFCNRARPVMRQVMEKYRGKVHFTYRHLPLSQIHPRAREFAEASECAADQGKFWPFHDMIFDNFQEQESADMMVFARQVSISDPDRFAACVQSRQYAERVEEDLRVAKRLGIAGTPTFFVGRAAGDGMLKGVLLAGVQPLSAFDETISRFLAGGIE